MPATKRKFAAPPGLLINSSTTVDSSVASTTPSSGAFVITGGVGIGDTLNVKGHVNLWNNPNTFYTGLRSGTLTTSTYYILPSNFPGTGTSVLQSDTSGVLAWVPMTATSSGSGTTAANINVVLAGTSASHPLLFTPTSGTASGVAVSSNSTLVYNPSTDLLSVSGLAVTSGAGSSNATTGALVVTGGVGIGGSLNVNNKTRLNGDVYISSNSNDSFYSAGHGGVAGNWTVGVNLQSGKYFLGLDLGLHPVGGNQSVVQTVWGMQLVGNSGVLPANYTASAVGANNAFGVLIPNQQAASVGLAVIGHASQTGDLQIWTTPSGLATTTLLSVRSNGQLYSYVSIASTSPTTGALVVTGSVGIGQSVSLSGRLQMFNGANYTAFVSSASGSTVYTLPATSPATGSSVLQSTAGGVMSWVPMTASGAASGNTSQNIVVNAAGNVNVFHPVLFTPSSLSAGSAVSSDLTISFNPSTEILNVSGLAITSGTASTNNVTGALIVRGGLGVSGQLSFVSASMGFTGITYNPTMAFIGNTSSSPITLTVLTDNSLNFEGSQGSVFSIDSNLSSGEIFSVSDISGLPIISASAGQTVNINEFGGFTQIGNGSINSSSTTTGSLVVSGGLGVTGNANIGGTVRITNTTASTTSSSGALTVSGGVGIGNSISVAGRLQLFNGANYTALVSSATGNTVYTLPATSPATGSSVLQSTAGGVMSWVAMSSGSSPGGVTDGSVQYKSGSGFAATNSFFYDTTLYALRLSNFPAGEATSQTSAALKVEQTTGTFNGSINGTMIAVNANNGFTGDLINLQVNAVTRFKVAADGAIGTSSGFNAGGDISVTSGTNSSSTTTGALQVKGGVGITGNAFIGGTTTITNTTASVSSSSGALVVAGGVGIGQTLFVGGNLYQNTNAITAFDTGFRNRIINGDGNIDQRSDGSSTTPGVGATNFIDRWKMNVFGSGRLTIGKNYGAISSPDGFVSYIGMKTTTTSTPGVNDYNFLSQVIEGVNTIDLQWGTANAKPLALSFWAYSSLTGTFGGSIRNYGTYNRTYPFTYTISSSNTWEKKTVVISGDTTGTWTTSHLFGIEIIFTIANGTGYQATPFAWAAGNYTGPSGSLVNLIGTLNATLYLTGIQAEIGSVATPYERRNYGHEFALCQRYYQITEVRTGGYHTTGNFLRGSVFLNTAARPISSPVFTVLSTDESLNHGTLNVDNSNFRGDSFRYLVQVTTTGDAFGQWKVGADFEF